MPMVLVMFRDPAFVDLVGGDVAQGPLSRHWYRFSGF